MAYMLMLFLVSIVNGVLVTIDNRLPRLDINGVIIDAHDGSVQQFVPGGLYYMHAMQYGLCQEPPNYGCDGVSHQWERQKRIIINFKRLVCLKNVDFNWIIISVSGLHLIWHLDLGRMLVMPLMLLIVHRVWYFVFPTLSWSPIIRHCLSSSSCL